MTFEVTIGRKKLQAHQGAKMGRMSMLLWGRAACGKTTLAETAPGEKLWINFDPDGTASLQMHKNAPRVYVLDFAGEDDEVVTEFMRKDQGIWRDIGKQLKEHPEVQTVVVDSLTAFGDKALEHGVEAAKNSPRARNQTITLEDPGQTGYGFKNTYVTRMVKAGLELTHSLGLNIIFVSHEATPDKDKEGNTTHIFPLLGSSLRQTVPAKISEVWYMEDSGRERTIYVRNKRPYSPMRSRMFRTRKPSFVWEYDADERKGEGIAEWFAQWKANEFNKIELPAIGERDGSKARRRTSQQGRRREG